ncbi:MAG: Gfo/Idh/MocA family oxidoreductase [Clostridia bacterium]|nr:Gfo/Idh/MocA family oxidoreductase [Clostridia bacterium]
MVKVAMIGFGGIAQAHRYAYWLFNKVGLPVQLIAACDTDPEKFKTVTKINIPLRGKIENERPFTAYSDWREMLTKEQPDLVDICLPTPFHKPVVMQALEMGFHVMCEKPMAETYADCLEMVAAAQKAGRELMIAQCVQFQPEYEYLQKAVEEQLYGKVIASEFYRYSPLPSWGNAKWREESGRTGSCLAELNIHDIDTVQAIFGLPEQLSCDLQSKVYPYDFAESQFMYPTHTVTIKSAWYDADYVFNAGYRVEFEKGVLEHREGKVFFTDHDGQTSGIPVEDADGIMGEIRYFVNVLEDHTENRRNPPKQTAQTIYSLEKCYESADAGGAVLRYEVGG